MTEQQPEALDQGDADPYAGYDTGLIFQRAIWEKARERPPLALPIPARNAVSGRAGGSGSGGAATRRTRLGG